ncbi:ABC transporter substrate-binding protein [Marmoricola endophyticus]|uniref:ABC transporter substrate-binding protein n=1 Tax=Marmoricola endophyticus TaxID=2040280 RepID=A0A917F0E3_9ACTN|nr:ABC transporter substrate-binding protein [Marmoricola endophyticus]GGF39719.1 ABC transporter substrate-binding protein [Marmoricola endophyticus]
MTRHRTAAAAIALTSSLALAGCGAGDDTEEAGGGGSSYPVTVENCGQQETFDAEPSRVVLLKSASVPYLADLGVLDRVTAKAGEYPAEYFDDTTQKALDAIPSLTSRTDSSGHLLISKETVLSQRPDLVFGEVDSPDRASLKGLDIPVLEEPALCENGAPDTVDFDDVYDQMTTYGKVFGKPAEAERAVADLKERTEAVSAKASKVGAGRSAAFLYPTVGGGPLYAYGKKSMTDASLKAAGFTNVFGDTDERVFEIGGEQLLARNPDVIVMLYSDGSPAAVQKAVTDLPGASNITAVKNGDLLPMLFNFAEPPSPLSVDGVEKIAKRFGAP